MPSTLTITALFVSFFVTFVVTPFWIPRARKAKLVGHDVHKKEKPEITELGGLCVIAGFIVALLFYVATRIFSHNSSENLVFIFATIIAILIATGIGFVDDILGWKIGLRARYKVLLTFFVALPIIVINAGHAEMIFPFLGVINFGILYPLIIIPLAIMGTANGFNMIAGYNGLETLQGITILSTLTVITYVSGPRYVALISACMVMALLAFYVYNKYPSKIFPGDALTYPVGALIAIIAILGDVEKYALVLFIPYFIEFILKARGKFVKESFAKLNEEGNLVLPYSSWYGIEHIAIHLLTKIRGKATEKRVVSLLVAFQLFFVIISLGLFYINM
jgi:UDP-N-acetylglucosamine--dolichyl-phosphate N-acetylglucosaminephosphotransferase